MGIKLVSFAIRRFYSSPLGALNSMVQSRYRTPVGPQDPTRVPGVKGLPGGGTRVGLGDDGFVCGRPPKPDP